MLRASTRVKAISLHKTDPSSVSGKAYAPLSKPPWFLGKDGEILFKSIKKKKKRIPKRLIPVNYSSSHSLVVTKHVIIARVFSQSEMQEELNQGTLKYEPLYYPVGSACFPGTVSKGSQGISQARNIALFCLPNQFRISQSQRCTWIVTMHFQFLLMKPPPPSILSDHLDISFHFVIFSFFLVL